jgi:hypothetical protein
MHGKRAQRGAVKERSRGPFFDLNPTAFTPFFELKTTMWEMRQTGQNGEDGQDGWYGQYARVGSVGMLPPKALPESALTA